MEIRVHIHIHTYNIYIYIHMWLVVGLCTRCKPGVCPMNLCWKSPNMLQPAHRWNTGPGSCCPLAGTRQSAWSACNMFLFPFFRAVLSTAFWLCLKNIPASACLCAISGFPHPTRQTSPLHGPVLVSSRLHARVGFSSPSPPCPLSSTHPCAS